MCRIATCSGKVEMFGKAASMSVKRREIGWEWGSLYGGEAAVVDVWEGGGFGWSRMLKLG